MKVPTYVGVYLFLKLSRTYLQSEIMKSFILISSALLLSQFTVVLSLNRTSAKCAPPYLADITYLGCYTDPVTPRTLSGPQLTPASLNTPQNCANLCGLAGFAYSGVEYIT